jgi:O-antigen/teichoic acid export membrane protein
VSLFGHEAGWRRVSKSRESSVRRYGINAVSSVGTRILQLTVLVWVNQFLLKRIEPQEYSLYPLVLSLMVFAEIFRTIFTAGIGRYIVEADSCDDDSKVTRIVSSMFPVLVLLAALIALVGGLAAWQLEHILNIEPAYLLEARMMLLLLVSSFCLNVVAAPFTEGLYARQRFVALNLIGLGSEVVKNLILLALLFGVSAKVIWLVVSSISAGIGALLIQIVMTRRIMPAIRFRKEYFSIEVVKTLTGFGAWTTIGGISSLVSSTVPALLLNRFGSAVDVTAFHLGRLSDVHLRGLIGAAGAPAQPALTMIYATRGGGALTELYNRGGRYYLWVALVLVGPLMVFGKPIIELYVGARYQQAADVIFLILGIYPFLWASAMFFQVAHAMGKVRTYYICDILIQILAMAGLLYAVAYRGLGAWGAAMALALAHGGIHLLLVWPAGLSLVGGTWKSFARQTLVPGLLPFAAALAACYSFRSLIEVNSWLMVGLGSLISLAFYSVVLLLFCLDPLDKGLVGRASIRLTSKLGLQRRPAAV